MRVDRAILTKGFLIQQAFFLDCWFNMSHELSLDSDRATFLNPIRAVRELLALYNMGASFGAAGKRVVVATELAEVLATDPVVTGEKYRHVVSRLTLNIQESCNSGEAEQCRVNKKQSLLISLCRELLHTLEINYLEDCFQLLKVRLNSFNEEEREEHFKEIVNITNAIIGGLSANGSDIQETNAFYRFILMKEGDDSFDTRLEHLISAALSQPEEYELTFKIKSTALVEMIDDDAQMIRFGNLTITPLDARELEAKITLLAQSYTTAGTRAYDILSKFVDALSYTLGKQEITIVNQYVAKPVARNRPKSFKIHRPIPNPNYQFEKEKFLQFCQSIEASGNENNLGIKDNKISAAFRLLRVGSHSPNTESKYTSYWTALESLTRDVFDRQGGDDEKVIAATVPCIAIDYVTKKLKSFITAFHNIGIVDFQAEGQDGASFTLSGRKPIDLYDILLDANKSEALINSINEYPFFQYKLKSFSSYFSSSLNMYERIAMHERKVQQQLKRVYRTRNMIVHDAQNIDGLEQLCAHLEHYLKGCINTMLEFMAVKPTIHTPKEFFVRYHDLVDEVKAELDPSSLIKEGKRTDKLNQLKAQNYNKHSKLRELVKIHQ